MVKSVETIIWSDFLFEYNRPSWFEPNGSFAFQKKITLIRLEYVRNILECIFQKHDVYKQSAIHGGASQQVERYFLFRGRGTERRRQTATDCEIIQCFSEKIKFKKLLRSRKIRSRILRWTRKMISPECVPRVKVSVFLFLLSSNASFESSLKVIHNN